MLIIQENARRVVNDGSRGSVQSYSLEFSREFNNSESAFEFAALSPRDLHLRSLLEAGAWACDPLINDHVVRCSSRHSQPQSVSTSTNSVSLCSAPSRGALFPERGLHECLSELEYI